MSIDPKANIGLFELIDMKLELEKLFKRPVDLVEYGETLTNRVWLAATQGLAEVLEPLEKLINDEKNQEKEK